MHPSARRTRSPRGSAVTSLPRLRLPDGLLRTMAPLGRLVGQPNLAEVVSASAGVTYLFSSAKAQAELGFVTRDVETGLHDAFGAA